MYPSPGKGREQQKQTNELLNGIHSILKENAAAALVSETVFKKEIKDAMAELKSSITAAKVRTSGNTSSGQRRVANGPASAPAPTVNGSDVSQQHQVHDCNVSQSSWFGFRRWLK